MECVFFLGQYPELSTAELQAVLPNSKLEVLGSHECALNLELAPAQLLAQRLGGIVKVGVIRQRLSSASIEMIYDALSTCLASQDKVTFSLAERGRDHLPKLDPIKFKKILQHQGKKVRFIAGSRRGVSAATSIHNSHLTELTVLNTQSEVIVIETVAVQDVDAWAYRDRAKPYADHKKGMLPPKVARMMVNLALGPTNSNQATVYDPFCGTGTILLEAVTLGFPTLGSDADPAAVTGAQKNLDWLTQNQKLAASYRVFEQDATHVTQIDTHQPITALVTEPFLGKPKPKEEDLPGMFKGLEKLYLGFFKQWKQILANQARLVVVFPEVETAGKTYSLDHLIDKLADFGYTTTSQPLSYSRPQAIVKRQIRQFVYLPGVTN